MKPATVKNYPYTGEYYSYTFESITNPNGETSQNKVYATIPTEVNLSLTTNVFGQLKIDSISKMQRQGRLKNIRDKNNEEIYEGGEWEITQTAPILSVLGTKEGYQYVAIIIAGDI